MVLLSHDDMPSIYEQLSKSLDIPKPYDETEIIALLKDRSVFKIAFSELNKTVHRSALKEMFEVTKIYCKATNQLNKLSSQPWYQFWRVLRNCLSHDFSFNFNEYDIKKLPVTWSDVTIDESMDGQVLTHGVLLQEQLLGMLDEARIFVEEELS
jgi:DNA polymerase elongation subunit (family B)